MADNAATKTEWTSEAPNPDNRLTYSIEPFKRATHYLFRYPAKFHPPVARQLVETYTQPGATILDPFCGSGTLMVEASMQGRHSVGSDIDPVAVAATAVKAARVRPGSLDTSAERLLAALTKYRRTNAEYEQRQFDDYSESGYRGLTTRHALWVPTIPNIFHWFRKYVLIDLAIIRRAINLARTLPEAHRRIFTLCFGATIRRASNADPVPVSGLEVTKHMRKLDEAGRVINPFLLFEQEVRRTCAAFREYWQETDAGYNARAYQLDARKLGRQIRRKVDAVITSPPYHGAVDYYRRHTLETYWLGFATAPEDRLALLPSYIGRAKVSQKHEYSDTAVIAAPYMLEWEKRIRRADARRADAFKHYALSMRDALSEMARLLAPGCPAVLVVGNSRWEGQEIDTSILLSELAARDFAVKERRWYPLKNRYMSYSRHNGASIDCEHVLVLERKGLLPGRP